LQAGTGESISARENLSWRHRSNCGGMHLGIWAGVTILADTSA